MEALFSNTLFGSSIWFWISVVVFLIICFISDVEQDGHVAFIMLILFSILYYFLGDVKGLLSFITLRNGVLYFGVGLGYSIIRSFFSARSLGKRIKDLPKTREDIKGQSHIFDNQDSERERFLNQLKENVLRWWFMWPINMITYIISDIAEDVYTFVYHNIKGIFEFIVDLGIKSAK
jgi:hypothetical protein